jgi:hypothetical protein
MVKSPKLVSDILRDLGEIILAIKEDTRLVQDMIQLVSLKLNFDDNPSGEIVSNQRQIRSLGFGRPFTGHLFLERDYIMMWEK